MVEECMKDVDIHFIKNDEDPQAYEHFKKFYSVAKVMRRYYKKVAEDRAKKDAIRAEERAKSRMAKLVILEQKGMVKVDELGDLDELLYSIDFYDRIGITRETIREVMNELNEAEGDPEE